MRFPLSLLIICCKKLTVQICTFGIRLSRQIKLSLSKLTYFTKHFWTKLRVFLWFYQVSQLKFEAKKSRGSRYLIHKNKQTDTHYNRDYNILCMEAHFFVKNWKISFRCLLVVQLVTRDTWCLLLFTVYSQEVYCFLTNCLFTRKPGKINKHWFLEFGFWPNLFIKF